MKRVFSTIFSLCAALCLGVALISSPASNTERTEKTIDKNRAIEAVFQEAASYVDVFNATNARLPIASEFEQWAETQPTNWPSVNNMFLETNPKYIQGRLYEPYYDIDKTEDFGIPPDGSYIIGLWRGEWFEYYISWRSRTTLTFDAQKYYILGSAAKDFALFIFLFLLNATLSIWLWRSSKTINKA